MTRTMKLRLAGTMCAVILLASTAQAVTYYWDTTATTTWATGANWSTNSASGGSTGVVPTGTDTAVFNQSAVNGNETVQLNAGASIAGITFANTGTTLIDSSSTTAQLLTLGSGGLTINPGAGAVTLGNATNLMNIAVSTSQSWTNNAASLLTIVNSTSASVSGTQVITIGGAGNTTISGSIADGSGTLALTKTDNGILTLSGSNTFSGGTTLYAGQLSINHAAALGTGALTIAGGTIDSSGVTLSNNNAQNWNGDFTYRGTGALNTGTGAVTLGATRQVTVNANTLTVGGIMGDSSAGYGLTKAGTGTLVLTASNTYSGATTVLAGILNISGTNGALALSASPIALSGGTLTVDNTGAGKNNLDRLANTQAIRFGGGTMLFKGSDQASTNSSETVGDITIAAVSSSSGAQATLTNSFGSTNGSTITANSLTRTAGAPTLLVNGSNLGKNNTDTASFARTIITSAPTLVGYTAALTTGINSSVKTTQIVPFLVGEATATTGGFGTATGTPNTFVTYVAGSGLRPLNLTDEFSTALTNATAGQGPNTYITSAGTSSAASVYLNSLVMNGGNLTIASGNSVTLESGALLFVSNSNFIQGGNAASTLVLAASTEGIVTVNSGVTGTIAAAISTTTAGLTKSGPGALVLSGSNTYPGPTSVSGGAVQISQSANLGDGSASNTIALCGGTLRSFGASYDLGVNRSITLNGPGTLQSDAGTLTVSGSVANSGNLLTVQGFGDTVLSGIIGSGAGGLTKSGLGTLTFNGSAVNTYTGATTAQRGTLALDFANLSTPTDLVNNGSPLVLAGGTFAIKGQNAASTSQSVSGLTANAGASVVTLDGDGSTKNTVLNLGAVARNPGSVIAFSLPGGTQSATNGVTTTSTTLLSNNVLVGAATNGVAFATVGLDWASLSGNNIVPLSSVGSYTLASTGAFSSANNMDMDASAAPAAFTANTLRFNNDGTSLALTGTNTIGAGGILVTANATVYGATIVGDNTTPLRPGAGRELVVVNNGKLRIGTPIIDSALGASAVTYAGTGITNLTGSNTYSGVTYLNSGTVQAGVAESAGNYGPFGKNSGAGAIVLNGGVIRLTAINTTNYFSRSTGLNQQYNIDTNGQNVSLSGLNSIGGSFAKYGPGTVTINGNCSYTGPTAIYGGQVTLNSGAVFTNLLYNGVGTPGDLILGGGYAYFNGNGASGNSQTFGNLILAANGGGYMAGTYGGSGVVNVRFNSITRNPGGSLGLNLQNFGPVYAPSAAMLNGVVPGVVITSATYGFGTINSSGQLVSAGLPGTNMPGSGASSTTNYALNSASATTVSASETVNALWIKPGGGSSLTISSGQTLSFTAQEIGYDTTNYANFYLPINGPGQLGASNTELIFFLAGGASNSSPVVAAPISAGTGSLTVGGNGTLMLTGTSTYSGATVIGNQATLQVGNNGTAGIVSLSSPIVMNGTLKFNRTNAVVQGTDFTSTPITGAGGLTQSNSSSTVTLNAANTYVGATTVTAGELDLNTTGAPAFGGNLVVSGGTAKLLQSNQVPTTGVASVSGGTLDLNGNSNTVFNAQITSGLITGAGTLTSLTAFDVQGGTVSSILAGNAGLTKSGAANAFLNAANLYTGNTTLSGGSLTLAADNAINNSGTLFFNNGVLGLVVSGNATVGGLTAQMTSTPGTMTIAAGKSLTVNGGVLVGNNISNNNTVDRLTVTGAGTLAINSAGGTFRVGNSNTMNEGATLDMSGLGTFIANLGSSGYVTIGQNSSQNYNSDRNCTLTLAQTSTITAGVLSISPNDYVASSGTPTVQHTLNLGTGVNILNVTTIDLGSDPYSTQRSTTNNAVLQFSNSNGSVTVRDATGSGRATMNVGYQSSAKFGSLQAVVNFSGHSADLRLDTLNLGYAQSGSPGGTMTFDTGTLDVTTVNIGNGSGSTGTLNIGGGIVTSGSGGIVVGGGGTGTLNLTGGTITMGGNITRTGGTGTLVLDGATLDMANRNIGSATAISTLTFNSGTLKNVAQINNGTTALTKTSIGTLTLLGSNTYTGGTAINAGILAFASGALGSTGNITFGGGTLRYSGTNADDISPRIAALSGNVTAKIDTRGNDVSFAAALTGTGSLTKLGSGVLTLAAATSFSGDTTVADVGSVLSVSNPSSLGGGNIFLDAGALRTTGSDAFNTAKTVTLYSSSILDAQNSAGTTFSGPIIVGDGTPGLTKTGSGLLTLSGSNSYTGGTIVAAGTLSIGNSNALGATTGSLTVSGGTLDLQTYSPTVGAVTLSAGAITGSGTLTGASFNVQNGSVGAILAGSTATLTKTTSGTVTLAAQPTYGGLTDVQAGTLALGKDLNFGDVKVSGGTLDTAGHLSQAGTVTLTGGAILGTAGKPLSAYQYNVENGSITADLGDLGGTPLLKGNTGTVTLSGSNGYTGGTTVNNGTLSIATADSLPAGRNLTIAGGGHVVLSSGLSHAISLGGLTITSGAGVGQAFQLVQNDRGVGLESPTYSALPAAAPTPEPGTLVLLIAAAVFCSAAFRRSRRPAATR